MTETVVVLGSGYAGAGAIPRLEAELDDSVDILWISERPYHLVLHEVHRCLRNPHVGDTITIPVEEIKSPDTTFREARAEFVDTDEREIYFEDSETVEYDYLLVAVGSQTAFFGIDGLEEHALTLKSLPDALAINEAIEEAVAAASPADPARVIVGGGGQTGVQVAGEVAAYRDMHDAPIEIRLVEGLPNVLPQDDRDFQQAIRKRLRDKSIRIQTGHFVTEVDDEEVFLDGGDALEYDVLIWTGGITGQEEMSNVELSKDSGSNRIQTKMTFQTDDERVFAMGDAALIDQPEDGPAPPNAQATWQAAEFIGTNMTRAMRGQPLEEWIYSEKGTVVSVGESAVANGVLYSPINTFDGAAAKYLKKVIAVRWISDVSSLERAIAAWDYL